jgi:peptidoglycan/LPS O-acetylase OafA/YrhL
VPMKRDVPQLHCIRALAMVGIFLHHLYMGLGPLRQAHAGTLLDMVFVDLALGVVVFNIMTSFLLALPYVGDNPAPTPTLRAFLPKRLWRLCPLYFLCVLMVVLGNAVVYRVTDPAAWLPSALSHLFFVDNLRMASFMSNTAAYWWLGLLMQFTLAYPYILKLYRKYGPAKLTISVTVVVWPLTEALKAWGRADPDGLGGAVAFLSTFNLPARLPEFLIGMWMAQLWKENPDRAVPVDKPLAALIAGACAVCLAAALIPGLPTPWFASLAWTLAAFVALFWLPVTARLGRHPYVLWLSGASYGIYLAHQPILSYLDLAVASFTPWWRFLALLVLAWLVSMREAQFLAQASAWVTARIAPGK